MMRSLFEQSLINFFRHSSQVYFIITDIEGNFLYVNPLFGKKSGYTIGELSAMSLKDVIHYEDIDKCYSAIKKSLLPSRRFVNPLHLQEIGSHTTTCWELSVLRNDEGGPEAIQWIGIEDPKKPGEYLEPSELFYRNLIADSLDGILLTSEKGVISFASASVKKILGYEIEELIAQNAFEFLHPDDRERSISAFTAELENSASARFINARVKQKSGEWLWCMVRGHNLLSNPHVGAMLIYFCDDTLRKNAEEALIESEERFRHLIYNLNLGVLLLNKNGKVLICNQASYELLGMTEEQLIATPMFDFDWDIIHEDGSRFDPSDYPITMALRTGKYVRDIVMGLVRPGSTERRWLLVNSEVVQDNNGEIHHFICSFTDFTEQRQLTQQLIEQEIQKQKMLMQTTIDAQEKERSEIGRELHDNISQHLTTTRLYLEVAKEKADGELLSMINHAHKGLMDMVSEIRKLSQSLVPPSLSDIGLVASIQDLCNPLKNTHAFNIEFNHHPFLETALPDNMKLMLYRITQELINNIIRHAQASSIQITMQTVGRKLTLSVSDNGKGFDPKSVKMGLGFDNMKNRAGLFGGKVKIDSAPGAGTTIQVTIQL